MASVIQSNFRARRSFAASKCRSVEPNNSKMIDALKNATTNKKEWDFPVPNLIAIQKQSYEDFLQNTPELNENPERRTDTGLQGVFKSIFPICDFNRTSQLDFVSYVLEDPKYDVEECHSRGMTYEASVKINVRLTLFDKDENGNNIPRYVEEQPVYFGAIPLMTDEGTFIINGTERVVVSQLHRSPGAFFGSDDGSASANGKLSFSARIIPYRGSWVDFEFDTKDILHVRIDRRRKMPATILLRGLGYSTEDILRMFYDIETITLTEEGCYRPFIELDVDGQPIMDKKGRAKVSRYVNNQRVDFDIVDPESGDVLVKEGTKLNKGKIRKLQDVGITHIPMKIETLCQRVSAQDYYNEETGEIIVECNQQLTEEIVTKLAEAGIEQINTVYFDDDNLNVGKQVINTLRLDKVSTPADARIDIYARTRPGDPPTQDMADAMFEGFFFDPERYDLSNVGRLKLNKKFEDVAIIGEDIPAVEQLKKEKGDGYPIDLTIVTKRDIIGTCLYLTALAQSKTEQETYAYETRGRRLSDADGNILEESGEFKETSRWGYTRLVERNDGLIEEVYVERDCNAPIKTLQIQHDDIDHLGNRRVRAVGELLENQYRNGLARMERAIKERMTMNQQNDVVKPHDLINAKPVVAVVREYFGSSQLSQFMDQTNPLSELTHKRRLSALGPGGLTRERAGFEVRDVHPTHYGRICPIETPEGPNIGLIASLSSYARVNEYGFIETPYRKVIDGVVSDEVEYISALDEEDNCISPANVTIDENNRIVGDADGNIECHENGELKVVPVDSIRYIDVSPQQMVSVAAALVPFLENDDANRALMGANMQRQAVPLLVSEAPFVATGMERYVARDSGVAIHAKRAGTVVRADATGVIIAPDRDPEDLNVAPDTYHLYKYRRSNQGTCFNQIPAVNVGEHVNAGDVIVDGPSTDCGELSLGKNMVVAFVPWCGYNYEDAILLSERMVINDVFTSIHIEEFECIARDTKLGKEEITRDIPNVGDDALKDLDETGIIRVGAEIKPGDILVGKVTPKGETQLSPEEKLLRAIFGEKAGDVRDSSQRVPPGITGTVIDAKVFSRKKEDNDARTMQIEEEDKKKLEHERELQKKIIRESGYKRMRDILLGAKTAAALNDKDKNVIVKKGVKLTEDVLAEVPDHMLLDIKLDGKDAASKEEKLSTIKANIEAELEKTDVYYDAKIETVTRGDELPPGVIKIVKVSIAIKRKIQVGDKMAGRHGNKGVVSRVLPVEDMPYLEDGTPVDFVLNPLGVPSRMNIGQLLELHLGWGARGMGQKINALMQEARKDSCKKLRKFLIEAYPNEEAFLNSLDEDDVIEFAKKCNRGIHVATPVFDGAHESNIDDLLRRSGLDVGAKSTLFDGRTGEPFANDVSVGVMYMLKLHHLVDEKIHARSIGPYSLVTQQPLGGKTQFGGQRLGEMEVWAMMAYGAAYSLQEFLTVKSDDVLGRTRMYESIVHGNFALEAGLPESFNVLIKELQSLCLNIELLEDKPR